MGEPRDFKFGASAFYDSTSHPVDEGLGDPF